MYSATYSPEDNKLRLYSAGRLDAETYARVKAAGFKYAPKQELFVAPMWTPAREDLLIELCGEIGDEDTSLVERAEERAERFDDYSDKRARDAERARETVSQIADNIPFGQPILIGHHSEARARRDAKKIEQGMRRAINMWETSRYWEDRAKGALHHAKYKERPDVRARRIKGLEADKRKQERTKADAERNNKLWNNPDKELTYERAIAIANIDHVSMCFTLKRYPRDHNTYEGSQSLWSALTDKIITAEQARDLAVLCHNRTIAWCDRWINHYANRLAYEKAMLDAQGGTVADKTGPEKGGACQSWAAPGHGRGWSYIKKVNKVSVTVERNWGNGGRNFTQTMPFDKLRAVMTLAEVEQARAEGRIAETDDKTGFYLNETVETPDEARARVHREAVAAQDERDKPFDEMKGALKAGVQVVSAPQLFPTPPEIADQMIEAADLRDFSQIILEPSAGTGAIADKILPMRQHMLHVVEISHSLREALTRKGHEVVGDDFFEYEIPAGDCLYDRIIMNPPFKNGEDIRHIEHALTMLAPGGRLVALCANGPRQRERLMPMADEWEDLPEGSFTSQGTGVRVAMLVIDKPAEAGEMPAKPEHSGSGPQKEDLKGEKTMPNESSKSISTVIARFTDHGILALYGGRKGHGFWIYQTVPAKIEEYFSKNGYCEIPGTIIKNDGQVSGNDCFWMMADALALLARLDAKRDGLPDVPALTFTAAEPELPPFTLDGGAMLTHTMSQRKLF